jgi:hypothetical protein
MGKMNPEIKADWVKALRSEQYKQGVGALRTNVDGERRFCCLGVLADRAVLAGVVDWKPYQSAPEAAIEGEWQILPEAVRVWAGLEDWNPDVAIRVPDGACPTNSLAELNDSGMTFAEIAELIEERL